MTNRMSNSRIMYTRTFACILSMVKLERQRDYDANRANRAVTRCARRARGSEKKYTRVRKDNERDAEEAQ